MPDNQQSHAAQKRFHEHADLSRHNNRLHNPFLKEKEEGLAAAVSDLAPKPGARVLEVGCGEGSNLHFLRRLRPDLELTGMDFSPNKTAAASRHLSRGLVVCGDAMHLPFGRAVFDLVLMRDLLHHVNFARQRVLEQAMAALRPGGVLVIFESNGRKFLNRLFMLLAPEERGLRDSTPSSLLELGRIHGEVDLRFVEASFLVRSLGYVLGWPGRMKFLVRWIYGLASLWEKVYRRLSSPRNWTYMMLSVIKEASPRQGGPGLRRGRA